MPLYTIDFLGPVTAYLCLTTTRLANDEPTTQWVGHI